MVLLDLRTRTWSAFLLADQSQIEDVGPEDLHLVARTGGSRKRVLERLRLRVAG